MNTSLPNPFSRYKIPHPPKLTKKPASAMTLIVGIKCKDAVIIAADSQISYGYSSLRTDSQKIERVDFGNMSVLVALADNVANAYRFIDILRQKAASLSPETAEETAKIIQDSMATLRQEIRARYDNCQSPELNKIIIESSLNCSMTVGLYINREAHLIKIDLLGCTYEKSRAQYETDGCGASLADYILTEYHKPNESFELTALLATYAVWQVTKHDRYCRGPIVVGAVARPGGIGFHKHSRIIRFSQERVADLISIGEEIEAATRDKRNAIIHAEFERRAVERREWAAKELAEMPMPTPEQIQRMSGNPDHDDNPD